MTTARTGNVAFPVLEVADLSISFGGLKAVDGVSFVVERNRITTVIGPNGAGKSTLFNLISGALAPRRGRVLLEGRDMTGAPPFRMQAAGLARSFQITSLFFELSVAENLRLAAQVLEPATRLGLPVATSTYGADAREEFSAVQARLTRRPNVASISWRSAPPRIAWRWRAYPKLLLLDEPTQA